MENNRDILLEGTALAADRGGRRVYEGLDVTLRAGQLVLLRGANGSGKSTLLRQLCGLLPLAGGTLKIGDEDARLDPGRWKAALHYIGHSDGLKTALTLAENLDMHACTCLGLKPSSETIRDAAAALDLDRLLDTPIRYFSAGQRHRSSLAKAGLQVRSIWLLDEPTVGLDDRNRERLAGLINRHLAAGGGVIAATHEDLSLEGMTINLDDFVPAPAVMEGWG